MTLFDDSGTDEERAVEGMAALLDLMPRLPGEDDESLAQRMADWAIQQGPDVRWEAMIYVARAMIYAQYNGLGFIQLAVIGMRALIDYNVSGGQ